MEPKKNPKADLSKRSMLFFQLGMILMLFLSWQGIEWKTYDRSLAIDTLNVGDELDEEIPITQTVTPPPPPPPPPPAPEVIEVVEDEKEVEETIIESTETDQDEEGEAALSEQHLCVSSLTKAETVVSDEQKPERFLFRLKKKNTLCSTRTSGRIIFRESYLLSCCLPMLNFLLIRHLDSARTM